MNQMPNNEDHDLVRITRKRSAINSVGLAILYFAFQIITERHRDFFASVPFKLLESIVVAAAYTKVFNIIFRKIADHRG